MLTAILAFATNWLPDVFKWVGKWFEEKRDIAAQKELTAQQIELEKVKAASNIAISQAEGEIQRQLLDLQLSLDAAIVEMKDRDSARKREASVLGTIAATVKSGKALDIDQEHLAAGWKWALRVEVLSAAITPLIAACLFTLWAIWKAAGFWYAFRLGDDAILELSRFWHPEDWEMLWTVLGYYFGGRVKKHMAAAA